MMNLFFALRFFQIVGVVVVALCGGVTQLKAQLSTTKYVEGLREKPQRYLAITNLTLVPEPGKKIENATVIIRNDKIEAVGVGISIPSGATLRDGKGLWCYSAFIEPYTNAGVGSAKKMEQSKGGDDEDESPTTPVVQQAKHWNQAVKPQERAIESLQFDDKSAEEWRKNGFAILNTNSMDGIFRGSSAVIMARGGTAHEITLSSDGQQWISFRKGTSKTPYPSALMGSIALIRQTLLDADWYAKAQQTTAPTKPEINISYEALADALKTKKPFVFENENEHNILRAGRIASEFGLNVIYEGSGTEYKRLASLVQLKPFLILPLNFPAVPDVSSPDKAIDVDYDDLRHWDLAPENPARCDSAGLRFVFTTHSLKSKEDYLKNIRKAISRGLKAETALSAMTTEPAQMLGLQSSIGAVKQGYYANIILTDGDIFDEETMIRSTFVVGEEYSINKQNETDIRGNWTLAISGMSSLKMTLDGKVDSPSCTVKKDSITINSSFSFSNRRINLRLTTDTLGMKGQTRLGGTMDSRSAFGTAILPDGKEVSWTAKWDSSITAKPSTKAEKKEIARSTLQTTFPSTSFGLNEPPKQQSVLIKNTTVWTSAKDGVLKETDVLLADGVIKKIGKNLSGGDVVIDGTGKHLTPGIIDEHSHIAIEQGVNEGTHAITAEVRIGDVLFPDDINIYRQLSGGVTSSHLLHGSANPIGGQLQLIKLRWGNDAEGLKFKEAPGTIKFALGENVKQANWGDRFSVRYPQTRMGVQEIMKDGFQLAVEYERQMQSGLLTRRNLQTETLLEIIRGKRFIHCHSYVQSEILMLMRLAEDFNFKVKNFTHILEGYKVAAEMKEHGTTASSFADWWAYKMEVMDAIPQNPAILAEQGVVTSINSDDAEMARRLNQEAAKSVKYGGMSEEEALKMVTINPAIQLNVQNLVGSIEVGKHADIVLWSGHPLSNFSRVLQTYVDGRKYFDVELDKQLRDRDKKIRTELEQKAMKAIAGGDSKAVGGKPMKREYDCEDVGNEVGGNELGKESVR
jgi:imidazolonepropionase-like amidohydrolase